MLFTILGKCLFLGQSKMFVYCGFNWILKILWIGNLQHVLV